MKQKTPFIIFNFSLFLLFSLKTYSSTTIPEVDSKNQLKTSKHLTMSHGLNTGSRDNNQFQVPKNNPQNIQPHNSRVTRIKALHQAKNDLEIQTPPALGNFALPASQQPGPLFSFGQNIIDKQQVELFFEPSYQKITGQQYTSYTPSFLYGITDYSSLYIEVPVVVNNGGEEQHSSGLSDSTIQFEHAFYENSNLSSVHQATIVAAITEPTGSYNKTPSTGAGLPTYFVGTTYSQTYVNWLWFTSPGVLITPVPHNTQTTMQYLYQFGIGRNFISKPNRYIFSGLVEITGEYTEPEGSSDPFAESTGGNVVLITPSIWYSTPQLTIQLGVALPLAQHLYGNQEREKYTALASFAWTIN